MFNFKHIFFISLFFISLFASSQNTDVLIAKYQKLIAEATHDSVKVNALVKIVDCYKKVHEFEQGKFYNEQLLTLINANNNPKIYISTLTNQSYLQRKIGHLQEGLITAKQAIKASKNHNNYDLHKAYWQEANLFSSLSEFDSVEVSCQKVISNTNDKLYIIDANSMLGITYLQKNLFKKSIQKFLEVRELAKEINDPYGETNAMYSIGQIFIDIGQEDKALEYFKNAIDISQKNNIEGGVAYCNYMIGTIYEKKKDYKKALAYFDLAIPVQKKLGLHSNLLGSYSDQAEVYIKMNMYDSVTAVYNRAMELEKRIGSTHMAPLVYLNYAKIKYNENDYEVANKYLDSINNISEAPIKVRIGYHELMSKLNLLKKEYAKSYHNLHQFMVLKDSMDALQNKKEAYILESKYQFDKKEQEIEVLNAQNEIKDLRFYLTAGIGVIVLLALFFVYYRFRVNKKSKKDLEELDKAKSHFFANISHEFRTPLTLIMGTLQQKIEKEKDQDLKIAYQNTERLKLLIDELLDLSKIESGSISLHVEETNIKEFLKVIYAYFTTKADEKNINYTLDIKADTNIGFIDIDKVEKIIINLLSNAFKFTSIKGIISLNAKITTDTLEVSVIDTGKGISKEDLNKIFDRFYQVDNSSTRIAEGSGVGLALSKELTHIHKGELMVESEEGKGSEFKLIIPINKKYFKEAEISGNENKIETIDSLKKVTFPKEPITKVFDEKNEEKPWVLVAEDNADMQQFIYNILKEDYSVILASNGKEAYNMAIEKVPSIIISDYMMPEMNGAEFCNKIKEHLATSHIPVIMLTAKAGHESKLAGLENGADIYLTKPFDQKELLLNIRNLISQMVRYEELFKNQDDIKIKLPDLLTKEKKFLDNIYDVIEEKFYLEDYGVDQMADDLCLSRMQVHRKIKALTGKSPGDILRNFRMEKAKNLFKISSLTVNEVAMQVGFKTQSNFSRVFKDYTGDLPSKYAQKFQQKANTK